MKKLILATILFLSILVPASASAAVESAELSFEAVPQGALYKDAYRPINWQTRTTISVPDGTVSILPMRRATLRLGSSIRFVDSGRTEVCPDSKIGPIRGIVPIEVAATYCPNSIIGNGTALFQLGQLANPQYRQIGYMLVFNGGKVGGLQQIKILAWSYNTNAGVYIGATLQANGDLVFNIPRLTADSSVTELDLRIPGERRTFEGRELPPGQDPGWVRARCPGDGWLMDGSFLLGKRTSAETPYGDEVLLNASASQPCSGQVGSTRLQLSAKGPKTVRSGKPFTLRLTASNRGTRGATAVRLSGKGISKKIALPAESSRSASVKLRLRKSTTLRYTLSGAGQKAVTSYKVRVR